MQESMLKKHQNELDEKRQLAIRLEDERDGLRESLNLSKLELARSVDANKQLEEQKKELADKLKEKKDQVTFCVQQLFIMYTKIYCRSPR